MFSMFVALSAKCNVKTTNLQALLKQHHIPGVLIKSAVLPSILNSWL